MTKQTVITTTKIKSKETLLFIRYIINFFPACVYLERKKRKLKHLTLYLKSKGFKGLIIISHRNKKLEDFWMFDLSLNFFARIKIVSVLFSSINYDKYKSEGFFPETILKYFKGPQGLMCGIIFRKILLGKSNLKSRYINSLFYSKGFIFIRHHRYIFSDDLCNVKIQEIGPRLTLFLNGLNRSAIIGN